MISPPVSVIDPVLPTVGQSSDQFGRLSKPTKEVACSGVCDAKVSEFGQPQAQLVGIAHSVFIEPFKVQTAVHRRTVCPAQKIKPLVDDSPDSGVPTDVRSDLAFSPFLLGVSRSQPFHLKRSEVGHDGSHHCADETADHSEQCRIHAHPHSSRPTQDRTATAPPPIGSDYALGEAGKACPGRHAALPLRGGTLSVGGFLASVHVGAFGSFVMWGVLACLGAAVVYACRVVSPTSFKTRYAASGVAGASR